MPLDVLDALRRRGMLRQASTPTLTIAADDTVGLLSCLPPARWYHELELTDGAGNVSIIATGFFDLRPSITAQAVLTIGLKP